MRVLMFSNPEAAHTLKWVQGLAGRQVQVLLLGMQEPRWINYADIPNVQLKTVGVPEWATLRSEGSIAKALYLKGVFRLRQVVREFKPDLVHAHYVSSYGFVGALANVHPYLVSVWGSDIYDNPENSIVHRRIVEFSLRRADRISATSRTMVGQTQRFTRKPVEAVPFGIDLKLFSPRPVMRPFAPTDLVIGTIKTLHENYGIRYLLQAFALLKQRHPRLPLKLLIVGGGPQERELARLAASLGVNADTTFTGAVPAADVARYHNMLDVYVALSNVESFGVAVIEAAACGKPVVVTDVGGLPEVVLRDCTGIIVPPRDSVAAADAIERLLGDSELRRRMGAAAREHVARLYDLERNLDQMLDLYRDVIATVKGARVSR